MHLPRNPSLSLLEISLLSNDGKCDVWWIRREGEGGREKEGEGGGERGTFDFFFLPPI